MIRVVRIPFDNVALAAIAREIAPYVGGFVQEIRQPDDTTIALHIYRRMGEEKGQEAILLLCAHPDFARVHFITRRPPNRPTPPVFCATLRARIQGAELIGAVQVARDRVLRLTFSSDSGIHELIGEFMGKHSNLILIDASHRIISACKWVPANKSVRVVQSNTEYVWPPVLREQFLNRDAITGPKPWVEFRTEFPDAVSKFFRDLAVSESCLTDGWTPHLIAGSGAYPLPLDSVSPSSLPKASLSIGLEQFYANAIAIHSLESLRSNLSGQLDRILLARQAALLEIRQTLESGLNASKWQLQAELILAYGPSLAPNASALEAWDYQGEPVEIKLDPELDFRQNASRLFDKAKRAKNRVSTLQESYDRLQKEYLEIVVLRDQVRIGTTISELQGLQQKARERRWLVTQPVGASKEDRPFEGHKIRELLGPGGVRILYGDNAESNDYLTLRVAKPNDYWLHIRGSTSAHVVVQTQNHPEKIGKEHLMYAAKVAVQNSPSKHAGYVPVDYTLKKYVRKPRGAEKGTAIYTNEKTLHVES